MNIFKKNKKENKITKPISTKQIMDEMVYNKIITSIEKTLKNEKIENPFIAIIGTDCDISNWLAIIPENGKDMHELTLDFIKGFVSQYFKHHPKEQIEQFKVWMNNYENNENDTRQNENN